MSRFFALVLGLMVAASVSFAQAKESNLDPVATMDEATPAELEKMFGLQSGFGQMEDEFSALPGFQEVVRINVSISSQTLEITWPEGQYSTRVSTGRPGYATATGCYTRPYLQRMHYSKKYHNSPMPHSMFYRGGFAIHGTYEESRLGRPASHGCVRVSLSDAAYLYSIVQTWGASNTRICVYY